MDAAELLSGLDEAQREAVTSTAAPLCVHAGAGSGKTRVLTRRLAYRAATGTLDPRHALAITFTRKAAGELRARLRVLGLAPTAGTFHAVANAQLQQFWDSNLRQRRAVEASKARLVGPLLGKDQRLTPAVVAELDWAAAQLVGPDDYADRAALAGRRPPRHGDWMAGFLRDYEQEKQRKQVVDFDDLLRLAADVMSRPREAAARRWLYRHLFVDEFQDVNPLQFRLLRAWLGDDADLFVVGDPHQAIYGWNGADASHLDRFQQHFPGAGLIRLTSNHRSTPQIVATGRAVLDTTRQTSRRAEGARPAVVEHADEVDEAAAIATALQASRDDGAGWSDMAVLVRTVAQTELVLDALAQRRIPHQVAVSDQLLDHPVVQRTLARLHDERYESVVGDLHPEEDEDDTGQVHAVLRSLAADFEDSHPHPTSAEFRTWLLGAIKTGEADIAASVKILTIHAAKGREWPIVHVAGVEEGLLPISHAKTDRAVAEERRLLYVATTRAQQELTFHWCRTRRGRARQPSRWLADVERAIARMEDAAAPVDGRHHLPPRAPGPDADPVVERLEAWREQQALVGRVPAEAVLDDLTLQAIAEAQPRDAEALAGVPGLGPVKAARFGDDLLAAVRG